MSPVPGPPASHAEITLRSEVATMSIQAAVSAVDMLHANLRSTSRILSSNAMFVTLSAATVIVAASLVLELDISLGDGGPYENAIAKALQVLDEHRWQIEGAPAAKHQLEKFVEAVKQAKRRRNGGEFTRCFVFHFCSAKH